MDLAGFHHVAIRVLDVERVSTFYRDVLGLPEIKRHFRPDGTVRSVWISAHSSAERGAGFLAIEHATEHLSAGRMGFAMVAFNVTARARNTIVKALATAGLPIVKQTPFTIYVHDPEGNLVGFSHYPESAL